MLFHRDNASHNTARQTTNYLKTLGIKYKLIRLTDPTSHRVIFIYFLKKEKLVGKWFTDAEEAAAAYQKAFEATPKCLMASGSEDTSQIFIEFQCRSSRPMYKLRPAVSLKMRRHIVVVKLQAGVRTLATVKASGVRKAAGERARGARTARGARGARTAVAADTRPAVEPREYRATVETESAAGLSTPAACRRSRFATLIVRSDPRRPRNRREQGRAAAAVGGRAGSAAHGRHLRALGAPVHLSFRRALPRGLATVGDGAGRAAPAPRRHVAARAARPPRRDRRRSRGRDRPVKGNTI
ncbi:hypothetical protein EVAR_4943_1 [Eumeta japonica]|uniref:Uncharacterized protein n=1 Tax=Eumeta variegata TaxID=151549 RepID=A0A4C1UZ15_EUMVA|nr:hypothetical protein EVAR_4943_1 [Eumeta japonica]